MVASRGLQRSRDRRRGSGLGDRWGLLRLGLRRLGRRRRPRYRRLRRRGLRRGEWGRGGGRRRRIISRQGTFWMVLLLLLLARPGAPLSSLSLGCASLCVSLRTGMQLYNLPSLSYVACFVLAGMCVVTTRFFLFL